MRISAFAHQIRLGIFQFVLVQRQLRLGQFDLRFPILGKLGDARLVGRDTTLRLFDARVDLRQRTRGRRFGTGRLADRGGKGLVDFMVGQSRGFSRQFLFGGGIRRAKQTAGRYPAAAGRSRRNARFPGSAAWLRRASARVRPALLPGALRTLPMRLLPIAA